MMKVSIRRMSNWITSLLALAAIQVVCASRWRPIGDFGPLEGIEEDALPTDTEDYRYKTMNSAVMGYIKCSVRMCCPKDYVCMTPFRCKHRTHNFSLQMQRKCPWGVEQTA